MALWANLIKKQEYIPVGCVLSAAVAVCLRGGVCPEEGVYISPSLLWTEFLTHTCENITFSATSFAEGKNKVKISLKIARFSGYGGHLPCCQVRQGVLMVLWIKNLGLYIFVICTYLWSITVLNSQYLSWKSPAPKNSTSKLEKCIYAFKAYYWHLYMRESCNSCQTELHVWRNKMLLQYSSHSLHTKQVYGTEMMINHCIFPLFILHFQNGCIFYSAVFTTLELGLFDSKELWSQINLAVWHCSEHLSLFSRCEVTGFHSVYNRTLVHDPGQSIPRHSQFKILLLSSPGLDFLTRKRRGILIQNFGIWILSCYERKQLVALILILGMHYSISFTIQNSTTWRWAK